MSLGVARSTATGAGTGARAGSSWAHSELHGEPRLRQIAHERLVRAVKTGQTQQLQQRCDSERSAATAAQAPTVLSGLLSRLFKP